MQDKYKYIKNVFKQVSWTLHLSNTGEIDSLLIIFTYYYFLVCINIPFNITPLLWAHKTCMNKLSIFI